MRLYLMVVVHSLSSDLEMIYDSGSDIEQRVLDLLPERFNANYEA